MKKFEHKSIRVSFKSIGGIESCYILPDFKIAFDIGRCPAPLIDIPMIFVSHGHLDHASGLSYYFSQRSLKNLGPGVVHVPEKILRPLKKITSLWQEIEEFDYKSNIVGLKPGQSVEVQNGIHVVPVLADHRVKAYGYVVKKRVQKLKTEFAHLTGQEIARKKEKENLFNIIDHPVFAYSGDSTIEIIKNNEDLRRATVLFMECTYIDDKRSVERARKWGHTHLDEIIQNADLFENEKVVLVHLSRRYSSDYMQNILNKKLPSRLRDKFVYVD